MYKIKYYNFDNLMATIWVDYKTDTVRVENYSDDVLHLPFGVNQAPTMKDFEHMLEERCFPRTRDNLKGELARVGVDFYDPFEICKKTQGRCYEDHEWMEIESV